MRKISVCIVVVLYAVSVRTAVGQPVVGQVDDFEDGTTMDWSLGQPLAPGQPVNVADGGPMGAGDNFLMVSPRSRLAVVNLAGQWTGDYLGAGVNAVGVDLRTTHTSPLAIRAVLFVNDFDRWTSTNSFTLPNDGNWHRRVFSLDSTAVTHVLGGSNYNGMITNVARIMFRHQSGPPAAQGTFTSATMGVDNVRALPEPSTLLACLVMATALCRRTGRRHTGSAN